MNVTISGKHIEITPAIKNYIEDKVDKFEKLVGPIIETDVVVSVNKHLHVAEVMLKTHKELVKGHGESDDLYVSIDMAVTKVSNHLRKMHDKLARQKKTKNPKISELLVAEEWDENSEEE